MGAVLCVPEQLGYISPSDGPDQRLETTLYMPGVPEESNVQFISWERTRMVAFTSLGAPSPVWSPAAGPRVFQFEMGLDYAHQHERSRLSTGNKHVWLLAII